VDNLTGSVEYEHFLFQHSFGYVWQNQYVHNEPLFIQQLKQKLKDEYLQTWNIFVNQSSILCDYRLLQSSSFDIEKYVSVMMNGNSYVPM